MRWVTNITILLIDIAAMAISRWAIWYGVAMFGRDHQTWVLLHLPWATLCLSAPMAIRIFGCVARGMDSISIIDVALWQRH